jgi:hypothetical protein
MRGRLLITFGLAVAALSAWAAAPALSLRPYIPAAEDFEQRVPEAKRLKDAGASAATHAPGHAGEPAPRWISPPADAPHEFDLVGIAGEMRPVEIRVRDDGGNWGEWVETSDGNPIYVDGAEEVQVRAPFEPQGKLHYVNVSGTAGGIGERLLNSARGAVNSAFISIASTPVAEAIAPKPAYVTRSAWGADLAEGGCIPPAPPEYGEVRAAVIHHTVNANDYLPEEAAGIVLGICRFHVYGNGWNDIGYNALVDRFGTLYEGRAGGMRQPIVGAQAQGFNSETTSIASVGEHSASGLSPEAQRAVVRFLAWKMHKHGRQPVTKKTPLTSGGGDLSRYSAGTVVNLPRVLGHGDLGLTECPGASLSSQIKTIRRQVQKRIKKYSKSRKKKKGKRKKRGGKKKR